jgi:DNA polymerase-1
MRTLYIIDGYAQFFRAYHAIRTPMSSPVTKEPTNMTFGFIGMLLKLLRGESAWMRRAGGKPDFVCVALDVGGDRGTFRSQLYPEYKATRKEPPEDLEPQVRRCLDVLSLLGIPVLGSEGFEADDVIATLGDQLNPTRQAGPGGKSDALLIRVISKDKDLKQLLRGGTVGGGAPDTIDAATTGPGLELFDIHTDHVFSADSLKRETGLEPKQVIDMLALMGDTSDNVPGVDGVGDKTAAQLIAEYGSLQALLDRADQIKGKRGEKIREAAPKLGLSRTLVTLRHDVPVSLDLEQARADRARLEALLPVLRELGFNRYQEDVKSMLGIASAAASPTPNTATSSTPAPPRETPRRRTEPDAGLFGGGLFDAIPSTPAPRADGTPDHRDAYICVRTSALLNDVLNAISKAEITAIDTETTSLTPRLAKLCGISLSVASGQGWYIPIRSPQQPEHLDEAAVLGVLKPWIENPKAPKTGHNLKYDLLVLRQAGVELRGMAFDSMIASYIIDASRSSHSMDALALALLNYTTIPISELIGTGKNQRLFSEVPVELATRYAAEDADVTMRLRGAMLPQVRAMQISDLLDKLELPLVEVLAELEWNGIRVDPAELERQRARLQARIDELLRTLKDESQRELGRSFDPDSPKQLGAVLFNKPEDETPGLGIKPLKKTKTGFSTDAEVLEKLGQDTTISSPIPGLILEYRQLSKLVGTYLESLKEAILPHTGRIHASFNQTVAATGRLSSSDPNLQNIPIRTDLGREIRRAFIAEPGHLLVTADYSQIELRLLAHLSRDPALIEAFMRDEDIHTAVAAQIHNVKLADVTKEQRSGAKMVNFGIVYGITPYGLARRLNISDKEAAEIISGYKQRFSGISTFLEECVDQARRHGYVETMMKRRRPIPDIESRDPARRALAERMAINSVVQGSAADLIKLAMIDLHHRLSEHAAHHRGGRPPEIPGVRMLLQIHDELVFEAPEAVAEQTRLLVSERMSKAMTLSVPLKADAHIGRNWFEGK